MLGGVRTFLLSQIQTAMLDAIALVTAVPSPSATFGATPLQFDASYTPTVVLEGRYTPTVALIGKAQ